MANIVAEQEMFFNSFEPKMTNRFIMHMDGVPSFMVKGLARPNLSQAAKDLPHINLVRYVKGRTVWGTMQFTLYDPIVPSGADEAPSGTSSRNRLIIIIVLAVVAVVTIGGLIRWKTREQYWSI